MEAVTPLVSVVMPLYNKAQWVGRSIESILGQSYGAFELLVVDDGSTDDSVDVVRSFEDERISVIRQENAGVSAARNSGIANAKGEYVAFLDADDRWEPYHLSVLLEGFRRYQDAAVVGNRVTVVRDGIETSESNPGFEPGRVVYTEERFLAWLSRNRFPLHIGSTMFRNGLLRSENVQFHPQMRMGEDVNFILRLSLMGRVAFSDYTGMHYRHDDANSAMNRQRRSAALTPLYFEGISESALSESDRRLAVRFLRREYLKKAYQNRGCPWEGRELHGRVGGGIRIGQPIKLAYLLLRFMPEAAVRLYKRIKKRRVNG